VIFSRKSIRNFTPEKIPEEVLLQILEAGRVAPSCQNRQCWRFLVINDHEKIKGLVYNSGFIGTVNFFIRNAPLVIVACADLKDNCHLNNQDYYLVDTAIAFQQMMLMAWSLGIGSCWLGAFHEEKLKNYLKIPDNIRVVAMSPFGYPQDKKSFYSKIVSGFAGSSHRKEIENIVCYNEWKL